MFFEGNDRIYIAGDAWLMGQVRDGVEIATSEWAAKHMIPNEANSYVLGRFVEADRANSNKQYFKMGDLLLAQPTIAYAPLNINHAGAPVGAFVQSEMQYPNAADDHAVIEALSVFWKAYYPELHDKVQDAFAMGSLYYSMEAVPTSLSTIGGSDDTAEYAYMGRTSGSYPDEINNRTCEAIVLNNPHFVGGALILPPAQPGWNKADVKQLSKFMTDQWESAEAIHSGVEEMAPHESPSMRETLVNELILMAIAEGRVRDTPTRSLEQARKALLRVEANGTPEEKAEVTAAIYSKFPQLQK